MSTKAGIPHGEAGTSYRYRSEKFMLMAGVNYQVSRLKSDETFPLQDRISHTFTSLLPQAMLMYTISKSNEPEAFLPDDDQFAIRLTASERDR